MVREQALPINTVLCGDSAEVLKSLPSESVHALVTDPPFGIGFDYHGNKEVSDNPKAYWQFLKPIYDEALRVLKPGGLIAVWQTQLYFKYFWKWFGDDIHIYAAAKNFVQIRPTPINYAYDPVVMKYKKGAKPLIPTSHRRSFDYSVGDTTILKNIRALHPCPRPVNQVAEIVRNFVIEDGIVLDPFFGIGSTGMACLQSGRKFIGIEKESVYVERAIKRLASLQGQTRLA